VRKYFRPYYQREFDKNLRGKKSLVGVEVGVYRGYHAREMLLALDIERLYLVDPYMKYKDYHDYLVKKKVASAEKEAHEHLAEFNKQIIWIRKMSTEAAEEIPDGSLDFVYIDGNHQYDYVRGDMRAWYPKVKMGGLFGGHDYDHKRLVEVKRAVDNFCDERGLSLHKRRGTNMPGCDDFSIDWWVKNEMDN
jgi:hypothetical protein